MLFFFKWMTAYELRISDWSSAGCSPDLSCSPTTPNPRCFVPDDSARRSGYYSNVTRGEAHGIEAAAALTLGALTLDGNYSWIVAEDRSPGATNFGRDLPRRPRRAANASVRSEERRVGKEGGRSVRSRWGRDP